MAQRLARRAEDREVPVPVPPKTNFSIMCTLPVKSTAWGVKPHQNRPSKSRILAGYQILDFTTFTFYFTLPITLHEIQNQMSRSQC